MQCHGQIEASLRQSQDAGAKLSYNGTVYSPISDADPSEVRETTTAAHRLLNKDNWDKFNISPSTALD